MSQGAVFHFGSFKFYVKQYLLTLNGTPVHVPSRVLATLKYLLEADGELVPKEALLTSIWPGQLVSESSLTRAIADLRKILGNQSQLIQTVSGRGYRFNGKVMSESHSQSSVADAESLYPTAALLEKQITLLGVLPFTVTLSNRDQLGGRCAEDLTNELGTTTKVPLISVSRIADGLREGMSMAALTSHFGLSHLIEGWIDGAPTGAAVRVQMSQSSGRIVWATKFHVGVEPGSISAEVSTRTARLLQVSMRSDLAAAPAGEKAALLFGRALYCWKTRTSKSLVQGLGYALAAAKEDPQHAATHVLIANFYSALAPHGEFTPAELLRRAEESVVTAMTLDPARPDAHVVMGVINLRYRLDWRAARENFETAILLDGRDYTAYQWLGNLLSAQGDHEGAIRAGRQAYLLNPRSISIKNSLAQAHFIRQDFEQARILLEEILLLNPEYAPAHFGLGMTVGMMGRPSQAVELLQRAAEKAGGQPFYVSSLAFAYARWGPREHAKAPLLHLQEKSRITYVSSCELAVAYLANDDFPNAVTQMQRAVQERDVLIPWMNVDPRLQKLREVFNLLSLLPELHIATL